MAKEFTYKGKTLEELKKLSITEFAELTNSRNRRSLKRGFTKPEENLMQKIRAGKKKLKTHARNMVVLPEMVGLTIGVHRGNTFDEIYILPEMIGHRLGELVFTRKRVTHSAPGIGATKSTSSISVR
ncbi:MAG: 30S ribosomal protein S19 [Nanoarchaeota archaeon]|nr:30S ribosomal protein S19 [Nanoarchaeota archaeon]